MQDARVLSLRGGRAGVIAYLSRGRPSLQLEQRLGQQHLGVGGEVFR